MKRPHESPAPFDVRTKLLLMLALLSLPLLIISIIHLRSYQRSLNDQARTIVQIEAAAAASALESWIESNRQVVEQPTLLTPDAARELYARLHKHASPNAQASITVIDARGHIVPHPSFATLDSAHLATSAIEQQSWSDGVKRLTSVKQLEPFKWRVVTGVPLPENTPAGRSILILTATWALTLLASSLLGVWAVGRFTKPLRQLVASTSTLGEGKLYERVEVETNDEVGTLAGSFNTMAASLEARFNEVRMQRAFIEEVLDSLPLGVAVLDADLIVRRVNASFAQSVGSEAAALEGRGLYEAAAGLAVLSEVVEDVRRTRHAFVNYGLPLELVARQPETVMMDDAKFWDIILWPTTERSIAGGDLILILSEVSKRVRAEKLATSAFAAEKARAAELESIINQMTEGVIIVDARGRYRVNPSAARILARKPGEFRDGVQALIDDMALHDLQRHKLAPSETPLGRALERGESVSGEHVTIMRQGKDERVLEVSVTPLVSEEGRLHEGVVAVFRDITEEVRQHAEVVEAYDRLREHDRLKSAFVANVSHELRTPLNVIIGLCQLLERDRQLPLAPFQTEAVVCMERNARNLLELVNDLLHYSRLEAGRAALHLEHVDVMQIINKVIGSYQNEARTKGIELHAHVSPEVKTVWTDRNKFMQVVSNLVSNAIKFTSTGMVKVSAAPAGEEHWEMEVSDTGIGISSDDMTYIFDGFRQVDDRLARSYSGVGLGLAITRKIVELLEGKISVESKQQEGSVFRIRWPRATRQRTGTGSLVADKKVTAVDEVNLRVRAG